MEKQNLETYEKLRNVPKEAQKQFSNGKFSGTDINPMWRIKKMTEVFGMCGIGWYVEVVNREMIKADNGEQSAFISVKLYIKDEKSGEWSKPIYGEGGNSYEKVTRNGISVSDEAFKMAYTDAIGNAAKMLGLGADIWFENDKTKYTEERNVTTRVVATKAPEQPKVIDTRKVVFDYLANNAEALSYYKKQYLFTTIDELTDGQIKEIYQHLKKYNKI
jgi:hypothetical protein